MQPTEHTVKDKIVTERVPEGRCQSHPDQPWLDCGRCFAETAERSREAERRKVLAEADKVPEQFPERWRGVTTDRPDIHAWVCQFQDSPREARSLLLLGPTGTGKTYLGYATIRLAVRVAWPTRSGRLRLPTWKALTYADVCASLRPRGRDYDPEATLQSYRDVDLLFVDDLGTAKPSEFVEEATYRLINGRYEDMRPSIFTSNLEPKLLRVAVGDRIASRLTETCNRIVLDGPDRRRNPDTA